jgi:class 3 adenylate cyclase
VEQINSPTPGVAQSTTGIADADGVCVAKQVRSELEGSGERVLAVDLEAHSVRSFQGLTCLMQLSTRTQVTDFSCH